MRSIVIAYVENAFKIKGMKEPISMTGRASFFKEQSVEEKDTPEIDDKHTIEIKS